MNDIHPRHKNFAEIFARMCHEELAKGNNKPRVGRQAALLAGYGTNSWSAPNQISTADVFYNRLVKRPEVIAYLRELGIERVGNQWQACKRAG